MRLNDTHKKKHGKEFFLKDFWMSLKVNEMRRKDGNFQRQEHFSKRKKEIPRWIVQLNHQRTRIACHLVGSYVKKMPLFRVAFFMVKMQIISKM